MGIQALEQHRPGRPLRVRHQGAVVCLPDPVDLSHGVIMGHIQERGYLLLPPGHRPVWKCALVLERWLAHHGLGTAQDVARLSFLVEKYEEHLTYDLQHFVGVDLEDLWRRREWHRLLCLIDRLPRYSYYSDAVANDPEHAQMIADAQAAAADARNGAVQDVKIPLIGWTPEVDALTNLLDAVRAVQHTLVVTNSDPKKNPPEPPKPAPRPTTLLQGISQKVEKQRRQRSHETLVSRLLPHKRGKQD